MTEHSGDVPRDVEQLALVIARQQRASDENRDAITLWPERLHLARNTLDCIELFIEGSLESFAGYAFGRGLEFGNYTELRTGREFPAIVVRSGAGDYWVRPMAHLAYEALQAVRANTSIANAALLAALEPFLRLIVARQLLSTEHQLGLTGELMFLRELLNAASALGVSSRVALDRWTGWESSTRDFKGGGVAIEAKATTGPSRQHWVHPMYQLLGQEGVDERVYVYSVGLRVDRSRSYRLTNAITRVLEGLPDDSRDQFLVRVASYGGIGFDVSQWLQYELEPGFLVTQPPVLIRVDELGDIVRPDVFVGQVPPARAVDLRYVVSLDGLPLLTEEQREEILKELLLGQR